MPTADAEARPNGRPATDRDQAADLGARIAAAREARGLSQAALARLVPVGRSTASEWESGLKTPALRHVPRLCRVLGVDPNTLFDWEGDPH